jgi:hypothetical protein
VFRCAYKHLKTGGVMIIHPDEYKEKSKQNETNIWTSKTDDMDITFIENQYDPNPKDDTFEKELVYLIRKKGKLKIEQDLHRCGLFTSSFWRKSLKQAGFEIHREIKDEELNSCPAFCCIKPA